MIVYLARDIRSFVMYCVNGKPRSSLLIESTDYNYDLIILHLASVDEILDGQRERREYIYLVHSVPVAGKAIFLS